MSALPTAATHQILSTERLLIREMNASDLGFIGEMFSHPEVMAYYPQSIVARGPQVWLERQIERYGLDGHGLWLALRADNLAPVGQIGLTLQTVNGVAEIEVGYLLHRSHWGRGFATEGARACVKYGLEKLGQDRIVALIRAQNLPSQAVARRLGMVRDGEAWHGGLPHHLYATALSRGSNKQSGGGP